MCAFLVNPLYTTRWGQAYVGDSLDLISFVPTDSVDLVITSPPSHFNARRSTATKMKTST